VWFVVDASGSMAGGRWQRAQAGIRECLSQLTPVDFVGLITFNDKVNVVGADIKRDVNLNAFWRMNPGGGTALYDAIAQMTLLATKQHLALSKGLPIPVISYVIVLTDGEDTSSQVSLEETRQMFGVVNKLSNFKVILAGINLNATAHRALERLGSVGDRDIEFRTLNSNADIQGLFEHFTLQLKLQRTVVAVDPRTGQIAAMTQTQYVPAGSVSSRSSSPPRISAPPRSPPAYSSPQRSRPAYSSPAPKQPQKSSCCIQ